MNNVKQDSRQPKINISQLDIPQASASAALAMDIINQEEPDMHKLEAAIMHDPVLAGMLLKYANSPLSRRPSAVTNVPTALNLLGLNSVRAAVVTVTIRSLLPKESVIGGVILEHMTSISLLCKLIANKSCKAAANELEFLGLVHDVGILTLFCNYADSYTQLYQRANQEGVKLDELEKQEYGFTHGAVSAQTAQVFRLPELHIDLLGDFHDRDALQSIDSEKDRDTCILALAHKICSEFQASDAINETVQESEADLVSFLSLSDDHLSDIKQNYQSAISATKAL